MPYPPPRGGTPILKKADVLVGKFEKNPYDPKILFCGCGLKLFSPLRGANSKTTLYLLSYYFFAQYPKTYR